VGLVSSAIRQPGDSVGANPLSRESANSIGSMDSRGSLDVAGTLYLRVLSPPIWITDVHLETGHFLDVPGYSKRADEIVGPTWTV
jgi:hypothetical protein